MKQRQLPGPYMRNLEKVKNPKPTINTCKKKIVNGHISPMTFRCTAQNISRGTFLFVTFFNGQSKLSLKNPNCPIKIQKKALQCILSFILVLEGNAL